MDLLLINFIGRSIGTLGAILVARTALLVHHRVLNEHRIDEKVSQEMQKEQRYGILGLVGMIVGLVIEFTVYFLLNFN